MRTLIILLSCLSYLPIQAQYYYNNIVRPQQIQEQLKDYKLANVRQVNITSEDDRGEKMEDFSSNIQFSNQYKSWKSTIQSWEGISITHHQFNDKGQLIQSTDSTMNAKQVAIYQYENQNLVGIQQKSYSRGVLSLESNQYIQYRSNQPHTLQILQKGYDTINVEFVLDEKGKVIEEKIRKGRLLHQTYYYYYNDAGQLTDIVKYHPKANQLLPDLVFEYNSNGKISSMLSSTDDKRDYQLWKYTYNEKGLKVLDVCTGKQNRLIGKVMYQYK